MIKFYTPLGKVTISNDYFAGLVGNAVTSCYGVAGMHCAGAADSVRTLIFGSNIPEKGVVVTEHNGELVIDLHIKVIFGINVSAIVQSITNKVRYAVEEATNLKVYKINVSVDDIIAE